MDISISKHALGAAATFGETSFHMEMPGRTTSGHRSAREPRGVRRFVRLRRGERKGAVLSLELLLVLPILLTIFFSIVEFSLLLMAMQRVQAASSAACRVATLPSSDAQVQQQAMQDAATRALSTAGLVASFQMQSQVGAHAGDPVVVQISAPMTAASPDLLRMIGFSLQGRQLVAQAQMCRQ